MKPDHVQLQFECPECGLSGVTPDMPKNRAIALIYRDLSLRCPRCAAIIQAVGPWRFAMLKELATDTEELAALGSDGLLRPD